MYDQNKSPLQREFEQSGTYRVIRHVGDKVVQELNRAGVTAEKVSGSVQQAAQNVNRAVDSFSREFSGQSRPNKNQYSAKPYTAKNVPPVNYTQQPQKPQLLKKSPQVFPLFLQGNYLFYKHHLHLQL